MRKLLKIDFPETYKVTHVSSTSWKIIVPPRVMKEIIEHVNSQEWVNISSGFADTINIQVSEAFEKNKNDVQTALSLICEHVMEWGGL